MAPSQLGLRPVGSPLWPATFPWRRRRPAPCRRVYFAVFSVAGTARGHILQYAFVDDHGDVLVDACARTPGRLVGATTSDEEPDVKTIDAATLEALVSRACYGANLVAYHRVLQGGLLPPAGLAVAAGIECAWRRFRRVGRARKLSLPTGAPLALADCLARAGLQAPAVDAAAPRALAVRALWRWMDDKI